MPLWITYAFVIVFELSRLPNLLKAFDRVFISSFHLAIVILTIHKAYVSQVCCATRQHHHGRNAVTATLYRDGMYKGRSTAFRATRLMSIFISAITFFVILFRTSSSARTETLHGLHLLSVVLSVANEVITADPRYVSARSPPISLPSIALTISLLQFNFVSLLTECVTTKQNNFCSVNVDRILTIN